MAEEKISFFKVNFWDLWFQKIFRNFASTKYQFMWALFITVIYGMFKINPETGEPVISAIAGLAFLEGGFISFAFGRIIINTSLVEKSNKDIDTDS